ncbi:MAG: sulfotransferase [Planctomycetota bacterium]|jgi:LPS sulfotransferase NodH
MSETLPSLNLQRKPGHYKRPKDETFLLHMNELLRDFEVEAYQDYPEEFPIIFLFGLPRSGTTLLSQLIAHSFDVGYINNLMARFWLAPVTGIRLSKMVLKDTEVTDFRSHYATTHHPSDIHEFGYFWRHWLRKSKLSDFVNARVNEQSIDWPGLREALLNIQHEFAKPVIFKNIFGSYHIERFVNLFEKILFVYITRDPIDNAISILKARQAFYDDLNIWWSSCPVEYEQLRDLPYMEQIGGQVYYLRKFYDDQIRAVGGQHITSVSYQTLCKDPMEILNQIRQACCRFCDSDLAIVRDPPPQFEYQQYSDSAELGERFAEILGRFSDLDSRR